MTLSGTGGSLPKPWGAYIGKPPVVPQLPPSRHLTGIDPEKVVESQKGSAARHRPAHVAGSQTDISSKPTNDGIDFPLHLIQASPAHDGWLLDLSRLVMGRLYHSNGLS
jgi:hypothetical protein